MRESKFGGSWETFKTAISFDNSEKSKKLNRYINKCIEFETKNKKDLANVHEQVKEELIILHQELSSNITYN